MTGKELIRSGDAAQYLAEPMPDSARGEDGAVRPTVTLLNATPDPLGSLAALSGIYEGRVVRSLADVTDEQREVALANMLKTELNGPLEAIQFHFLVEGVSRDFTHQAVRDRFSFFSQESLRFAVKENWTADVPYPPSLAQNGTYERELQRDNWQDALINVQNSYHYLVNSGIPAEEARALLPHAVLTRYHWVVSLRTLVREAGKRTCTQAQHHWRIVFGEVARALREYEGGVYVAGGGDPDDRDSIRSDSWQFDKFAELLRPHCYQTGSCGFMAAFDRGCTIRGRVNAFDAHGIPSDEWDRGHYGAHPKLGDYDIHPIDPAEWIADPGAART